ncbi:MAG: hypothetical protein IKJ19_05205 [Clostridia bacterium]|nr:hypothetical protein [Clostridia bacterium]
MLGFFDDLKKEYVIKNMYPSRPLLNYLWNDTTVCACDQFGFGTSWSVINGVRRSIESGIRNLSIFDGERLLYIKDKEDNAFYSPNRNYKKECFDDFACHVGLGYQKVVSNYKEIKTEFTTLVPSEGNAVLFAVKIINESQRKKSLDLYFMLSPKIENGGHEAYTSADFDARLNGIYYDVTGDKLPNEYIKSYLSTNKKIKSFAVSLNDFRGLYNTFENPEGVMADKLCGKGSVFEEKYIGAFQYEVEISEGETFETVIVCGFGKNYEDCLTEAKRFSNKDTFDKELQKQRERCDSCMGGMEIETPDAHINSMANIWLKRQLSLGKDWGRLYGRGFRDVMQDTAAFVALDTPLARKRIQEILKHQYEDGNPVRMFEPDNTSPFNDSGAWIPATVLAYLYESGDLSVLDEKIPYRKGDSYENAYKPEGFLPYRGTEERYSVFEHVQRAMDYLYSSRGKRGLVLFRHGDWNDSLDGVGLQGKGESVWCTIATIKAYNEFIQILDLAGKHDLISVYTARRNELKENVLKYGFEGKHLLYGFNDYDEKIGSDDNKYAKIFLNPQTWAVLADLADKKTLHLLMDQVEERLSCEYGYVQCAPSYTEGTKRIGRMSYFKAGLVENGSVYNHGVAFKIVADCLLGRGDNAYQTLKKISYDNPSNPNNGMEPYAISNMYIGPESKYRRGDAPMSWVTGTAGWIYRAIMEYIIGIRPVKNGLLVSPCFPKTWNNVQVKRDFRGATYCIKFIRSQKFSITIDGKEVEGNVLPIGKMGEYYNIVVYFD